MATNTLVLTKDDYLLWTPLSLNIGDDLVDMATRAGQRKYLKLVLGNTFYDKIIEEIETGTPASPYDELITSYITPYLTTKCYADILSDSVVISTASGAKSITDVENNQTEANGSALGIKLRKIDQSANTFKQEMIDYLDDNSDLFPEWTTIGNCSSQSSGLWFTQVKKHYSNDSHDYRRCKRLYD